jgi:hypothetical protein
MPPKSLRHPRVWPIFVGGEDLDSAPESGRARVRGRWPILRVDRWERLGYSGARQPGHRGSAEPRCRSLVSPTFFPPGVVPESP